MVKKPAARPGLRKPARSLTKRGSTATKRSAPSTQPQTNLGDTLSVKAVRAQIAHLVDEIEETGHSFKVFSRGKHIAILGPANGRTTEETVPISLISTGKRSALGAAVRGGITITRDGHEVAAIYPPGLTQKQRHDALFEQIEQIDALKIALSHLAELRSRVEKFLRNYIDLVRKSGDHSAADQFEAAYRAIDRGPKVADQ